MLLLHQNMTFYPTFAKFQPLRNMLQYTQKNLKPKHKRFWVLLKKIYIVRIFAGEKFQVNLCLETSEHSVQTADDSSKVTSQAPPVTLALYVFKLVLYFNSSIISNQIKYYLAIKRKNCLQIQYGFYRHAVQIHYHLRWLIIERAFTKNSRKLMSGMWLLEASWWKVNKALFLYEIGNVYFTRRSCDKDWHLD